MYFILSFFVRISRKTALSFGWPGFFISQVYFFYQALKCLVVGLQPCGGYAICYIHWATFTVCGQDRVIVAYNPFKDFVVLGCFKVSSLSFHFEWMSSWINVHLQWIVREIEMVIEIDLSSLTLASHIDCSFSMCHAHNSRFFRKC